MTNTPRFDRTVRVVMWVDAFLSVGTVVFGVLVSPLLVAVPVPASVLPVIGLVVLVTAGVLAGCGAVTAVLLMVRMRAGDYLLPTRLRLPLPGPLRPPL